MRVDSDSMYLILYALMMLSAMAERLFKISKNWIWKHTSTPRFIWGSHFLLLYYGRMPFPSEGRHSCSKNRRGDLACDMYNLSQMWVQSEIIIACPQQFFFFHAKCRFRAYRPGTRYLVTVILTLFSCLVLVLRLALACYSPPVLPIHVATKSITAQKPTCLPVRTCLLDHPTWPLRTLQHEMRPRAVQISLRPSTRIHRLYLNLSPSSTYPKR